MASDLQSLNRDDKVILGAGVAAFIASFFPFYGVSVSLGGFVGSASINTWHSYATLGILLVIAATLVTAIEAFEGTSMPELPVSANFLVAGLSSLGTLLIILRGFTYTSVSTPGGSVGLKWGFYVVMVVCLVQVVFAVLRFRATGEPLPWQDGSRDSDSAS